MDEHRNVTDSEWKIMDQLWKNGEMTMTQITRDRKSTRLNSSHL